MSRDRLPGLTALAVALVLSRPASAQVESAALAKVQVNLINPGGKSLAMGGAFVSLADDSTAALANPSGLMNLGAAQVGASLKVFRFDPDFTSKSFVRQPAGDYRLDSEEEFRVTTTVTEPEFFSFVMQPIPRRLAVGVYRAVSFRYRFELPSGGRRLYEIREGSAGLANEEEGGVDIRNETYGLSAATQLGPVSLGAGVTFGRMRYELTGPDGRHVFRISTFSVPVATRTVESRTDSSFKAGFLAGFRARLSERYDLAIGGVYRRNPSHGVDYRIAYVKRNGQPSVATCGSPGENLDPCGSIKTPDDFSVGVSIAPVQLLTVALDVQRILYSQLNDGFTGLFYYSGFTSTEYLTAIAEGRSSDATVYRIGLEYLLRIGSADLALRAGYHREGAHGLRVDLRRDADEDGVPDDDVNIQFSQTSPFNVALEGTFDGGRDEDHVSVGLGLTVGSSMSFDLGLDVSSTARYLSASLFYRF